MSRFELKALTPTYPVGAGVPVFHLTHPVEIIAMMRALQLETAFLDLVRAVRFKAEKHGEAKVVALMETGDAEPFPGTSIIVYLDVEAGGQVRQGTATLVLHQEGFTATAEAFTKGVFDSLHRQSRAPNWESEQWPPPKETKKDSL